MEYSRNKVSCTRARKWSPGFLIADVSWTGSYMVGTRIQRRGRTGTHVACLVFISLLSSVLKGFFFSHLFVWFGLCFLTANSNNRQRNKRMKEKRNPHIRPLSDPLGVCGNMHGGTEAGE